MVSPRFEHQVVSEVVHVECVVRHLVLGSSTAEIELPARRFVSFS